MLSDVFPTGYHATELAGVKPGDSVVIYGAGPVGLMAAHSASIKGPVKLWWWIVILTDSSLLKNWVPFLLTFERFRCGTGTELPKAWVLIRVECVGYLTNMARSILI
jgi:hypothetical protein